jgi:uncharacterized protein DUF4118
MRILDGHRAALIAAAFVIPLVACAAVVPFRDGVANTNAALGLVLVVVAASATGYRPAGLVAALSSAAWFDLFLTEPYNTFAITDRADIETAVLLVLVGAAVSEIALWGRRQQARASKQEGYVDGIVSTAGIVAAGNSTPAVLVEHVARQVTDVLGIDDCRFYDGVKAGLPLLHRDGTVSRNGHQLDVDRNGLPTDTEIELLVQHDGDVQGLYLLTASTRVVRPSLDQRRVAVALADQAGAALATDADRYEGTTA